LIPKRQSDWNNLQFLKFFLREWNQGNRIKTAVYQKAWSRDVSKMLGPKFGMRKYF
jgi:hypothetical protein